MHFIQIDLPKYHMLDASFGFQIRTSYLFSDISTIIGNTTFLITYDYVIKNISTARKCELVLKYPDTTQELKTIVDGYFDMVKTLKSYKHAPNNIFVAFKKIENNLLKVINPLLTGISVHAKASGYEGIFEFHTDDIFVFFNAESDSIQNKNTTINVFKVLENKAPKNAIDSSIWLLPNIFYASDIYDFDAITDVSLIEANKPYLIKSIKLTNYNFISPAELTAIKHQLENEILPFKTAMEEWAINCHTATNGVDTFINKVLPTLKDTQDAIENNALLKHTRSVEAGKKVINLHMGEVTPPMLWRYYMLHEVLTENEYDQLLEEYKTQPPYTIPVIIFAPERIPFNRIDIENYAKLKETVVTADVIATKKSIDID